MSCRVEWMKGVTFCTLPLTPQGWSGVRYAVGYNIKIAYRIRNIRDLWKWIQQQKSELRDIPSLRWWSHLIEDVELCIYISTGNNFALIGCISMFQVFKTAKLNSYESNLLSLEIVQFCRYAEILQRNNNLPRSAGWWISFLSWHGSGAHSASYSRNTRVSFKTKNWRGRSVNLTVHPI